MSDQPLVLQWLCHIRDNADELQLSRNARALAGLLVTYGAGQSIYVSMVNLARNLGMGRSTVIAARRELEDRGLLEDITEKPDKQSRTYRLVIPQGVLSQDTLLSVTCPEPRHQGVLSQDRGVPSQDTKVSRARTQDLALDQASDQDITSSTADAVDDQNDVEVGPSQEDLDRAQQERLARLVEWDSAVAELPGLVLDYAKVMNLSTSVVETFFKIPPRRKMTSWSFNATQVRDQLRSKIELAQSQ